MEYHLKVATLNFARINVSPFEYHDGSEEKILLDRAFKTLFDRQKEENPGRDWNIGKIDKVFQRERYTVLYQSDCGCIRGKLVNKHQFEVVWDRTFDLNQGVIGHMNLQEESINTLRQFDWLAYHAFLCSVFGDDVDLENLGQYDYLKYFQQLKKWHSKSYLNCDIKIGYVKEYILKQELDILFLQEAGSDKYTDIIPNEKYSFVQNADSIIIFKKETYFSEDADEIPFHNAYKEKLNLNKDSCYLKTKNLLIMSVHLSSKKHHVDQATQMFETLTEISEKYKDLVIIVGTDANHKLSSNQLFKVYPDDNIPTTRKKRTHLQCQFEKANKLVEESKDFIVTNIEISSSRVETIRMWESSNELLPNDSHPFDHFLVTANLEFDKPNYRNLSESKSQISSIKILIGQNSSFPMSSRSSKTIDPLELIARLIPPDPSPLNRRTTLDDTFPSMGLRTSTYHSVKDTMNLEELSGPQLSREFIKMVDISGMLYR